MSDDEKLMEAVGAVGASDINKHIHRRKQVEVDGSQLAKDHVRTRDMPDVAMEGDLPFQQFYPHRDGGYVMRENEGQAAVDNTAPIFVKHGWEFYFTWLPNHGTGGFTAGLAVKSCKSERKGERAVLELDDLMMITEQTPILKKKLEDFINFALNRDGRDWEDPGQERLKLYNALQAVPDALMEAYTKTPYGKINNVTFVPSNTALESIDLKD